jgi:hypothetical protein
MKKLQTFDLWQRPLAGMFKELLSSEGIDCVVKNDQLFAAMGEIPFTECYPEIWIIDDEIYPRARLLLDSWLAADESDCENWTCTVCNEVSEGQFDVCWSCGSRPA